MPLFNKKFDYKPLPHRLSRYNNDCPKVSEELDDYKKISLNLGNKELRFADGIWIHATRRGDVDDFIRLNHRLKLLEEEKNMCDLKVEVLLDIVAENISELNAFRPLNN